MDSVFFCFQYTNHLENTICFNVKNVSYQAFITGTDLNTFPLVVLSICYFRKISMVHF